MIIISRGVEGGYWWETMMQDDPPPRLTHKQLAYPYMNEEPHNRAA